MHDEEHLEARVVEHPRLRPPRPGLLGPLAHAVEDRGAQPPRALLELAELLPGVSRARERRRVLRREPLRQDARVRARRDADVAHVLGAEAPVDAPALPRLVRVVVVAVLDRRVRLVHHRPSVLEQRPRHQHVLAEPRARERVALPQLAAHRRGDVVEVAEHAPLVGREPSELVRLGPPHDPSLGGVPRVRRRPDLRQRLRVRPVDVAAVRRAHLGVVEARREARQPVGTDRDRVLGQEHEQVAVRERREEVARVAVVELDLVDAADGERDREVPRGPLEERERPVGRARVDDVEVPGPIPALGGQRRELPPEELRALPRGDQDRGVPDRARGVGHRGE